MIKLQQATENLNAIFDNKDLLDVLIDVEDVFDGLDLYAFKNWIDGLVVSGPHVSRYWINVKLMYLHKDMPDPTGAQRLERHGCKIKYEKTHSCTGMEHIACLFATEGLSRIIGQKGVVIH